MAQASPQRTNPWIAFLAGAVAVLAVVLLAFGWQQGHRVAEGLKLTLRDAPNLPSLPQMPEGPKLPDPPIPKPK
jgi:hypothetical protein